jgi:hypothetical protein
MSEDTKKNKVPETISHGKGLLGSQWQEKISLIAKLVKKKTTLTLMGSAPNMLQGQPSRMSIDLDVWKATSSYDRDDLKNAVEGAGLLFNPTEEIPDKPYIQIVEEGICQLGNFKKEELKNIENTGNLYLNCPPIENLIASKLLRSEAKDLEDINWMVSKYQPNLKKVKEIINSFPQEQKEKALENFIFLEVIANSIELDSKNLKKEKIKKDQSTLPINP